MMIVNFSQFSQIHAPVITEIDLSSAKGTQGNPAPKRGMTTMVFLALGRDCTAYEILYDARHSSVMLATSNNIASISSPILSASAVTDSERPLVAILTSDGLVHVRSPSCLAVPLTTIGKK